MKIDELFIVTLDENIVDRLADVRLAMTGTAISCPGMSIRDVVVPHCDNYF